MSIPFVRFILVLQMQHLRGIPHIQGRSVVLPDCEVREEQQAWAWVSGDGYQMA
jgi:hypothetical protein